MLKFPQLQLETTEYKPQAIEFLEKEQLQFENECSELLSGFYNKYHDLMPSQLSEFESKIDTFMNQIKEIEANIDRINKFIETTPKNFLQVPYESQKTLITTLKEYAEQLKNSYTEISHITRVCAVSSQSLDQKTTSIHTELNEIKTRIASSKEQIDDLLGKI